jgi:hypothetical protein
MGIPNLCEIATFYFKEKSVFLGFNNEHFVIAPDK